MKDPRGWRVEVPWPAMAKKRPRFNSEQRRAYMPKEYMEWKENVAGFMALQKLPSLQGNVALDVTFKKTGFVVIAAETKIRRFGSADIDNLIGGVMDAIQDAGGYRNDRQVTAARMQFNKEET